MSSPVRSDRKREERFIKALLRSKLGAMSDGKYYRLTAEVGKNVNLDADRVDELIVNGVLVCRGDFVFPTKEAAPWLKRRMSVGDGFLEQHQILETTHQGKLRNIEASPVLKLRARKNGTRFLALHQVAAAERVGQWGERALLAPKMTMAYDPTSISANGPSNSAANGVSDMAMQARKSLARLYKDLPKECAEVIVDVCVFEKGLQTIESERAWPRRSAKLVLRIGLEQLAGQLGLTSVAEGEPKAF